MKDLATKVTEILMKGNNRISEARNAGEAKKISAERKIDLVIVVIGDKIFAMNPDHIGLLDLLLSEDDGLVC